MDDKDRVEGLDDTRRSLSDGLTLCRKIIDHYRSTLVHCTESGVDRPNSIFGRSPDVGDVPDAEAPAAAAGLAVTDKAEVR